MSPEYIGSVIGIIILVMGGLALFAPAIASFISPKKRNLSGDQYKLEALNRWLILKVEQQAGSHRPITIQVRNRIKGAAVKALYHIKREQKVVIQLPSLYQSHGQMQDFEVSITKEDLDIICYGFD